MIKILLNIRLNLFCPFDEQLVTRRVGHEAFQTSCVEPWLLLIFISRVLLTSLIFAFIVEPYFPHGNLLRSTKNRTKTGNFLHYRTCPSMRQTRPWETITFYPWKEEDIIPLQGWRQRPLPFHSPSIDAARRAAVETKGSSVPFSTLGDHSPCRCCPYCHPCQIPHVWQHGTLVRWLWIDN